MYDHLWKALLVEFLGTFTLVLIGGMAVASFGGENVVAAAFAFGLVFMGLIYAWGNFSGAHFNPAVSLGFAVAGRMNWLLMIGYWLAQLLGAIAAAALISFFLPNTNKGNATGKFVQNNGSGFYDLWKAVLLETILTFLLVVTILLVTRNPMLAVASGLAIGLVLTFNMFAGYEWTGASMNPARSLGTAIFAPEDQNAWSVYWVYLVGPFVGAIIAALIFRVFNKDWSCCKKRDDCGNLVKDKCGNNLLECKRPKMDDCGNVLKDCDGKLTYETYTKVDTKLNHMQETPLTAAGHWMMNHGISPYQVERELSATLQPSAAPAAQMNKTQNIMGGLKQAGSSVAKFPQA